MRLAEVEQNVAELEQQQRNALDDALHPAAVEATNGTKPAIVENDDLKEIIGIGKVFEHSLHELGIVSFRQIANFGFGSFRVIQ